MCFCLIVATIAFLKGKLKVGLTKSEIEYVAKNHNNAIKLSRRDLAYVLANKDNSSIVGGNKDKFL